MVNITQGTQVCFATSMIFIPVGIAIIAHILMTCFTKI